MATKNTGKNKLRIGVALGSGSARGWAHIGVLRELEDMGIRPDIISGCSIGSVVGAAYAADNLDGLEHQVLSMNKFNMVRFVDINPSLNGFIHRERLQQFFNEAICPEDQKIEDLPRKFASVATYLGSGHEMWFTEGKVSDAVMASISLPGLFVPFSYNDQWLVDGGLVNPVPVSLCRAMGADVVIAVNLNDSISSRHFTPPPEPQADKQADKEVKGEEPLRKSIHNVANSLRDYSSALLNINRLMPAPNLIEALAGSINIMQDKITKNRMAGDPPDVLLAPKLSNISMIEFYRAQEAIDAGRACVQHLREDIEKALAG